ncbi:MAG: hypothetical protein LBF34_03505 [Puniceicoccales bacterium]|nr:hypothetical protein [Puniceicoccales bacterium]
MLDSSTPAEEAVQILVLMGSDTQRDVARKMAPQRLEKIRQQGLAYQADPSGLLSTIATEIYSKEINKFMDEPGNEQTKITKVLEFLDQKTRRRQPERDPIVRETQRRLECLQNNGLIPPPPKTIYRLGVIRLTNPNL